MLRIELNEKDDDDAINAILESLKQDIGSAKASSLEEVPDSGRRLFHSFLNYCNKMPEHVSHEVRLITEDAERFLLHVKSLASSILASLRTFFREKGEKIYEVIERIKQYVVSIVCKIWNVFCLLFKSLREFSLELGFDGEKFGWPFNGKIGLVFDNPLRNSSAHT